MRGSRTVHIQNREYEVFEFEYLSGKINNQDYCVFEEDLDNAEKKNLEFEKGEIFIVIPSWFEMQDVYQSSAELNIQTNEYDTNFEKLKAQKLRKLCSKIIDAQGDVTITTQDVIGNIYPSFAQFILSKIDDVIGEYYTGSGLSKEEEKSVAYECFKYYSAINKNRAGKKVRVPPCPGIIMLLSVCETLNCTPDIARKIDRRDIDMLTIAREQEDLCKNPAMIGLNVPDYRKNKRKII